MRRGDVALKNFEYITYSTPNDAARDLIEDEDLKNSQIAFPDLSQHSGLETYTYLGEDGGFPSIMTCGRKLNPTNLWNAWHTMKSKASDDSPTVACFLKRQGYSSANLTDLKKMPESILINGTPAYMIRHLQGGDRLTVHIQETAVSEKIPPGLSSPGHRLRG